MISTEESLFLKHPLTSS